MSLVLIPGPQGVPGPEGPRGNQGSAGVQGPRDYQGEQGPEGPQGPIGTSVALRGSVEDAGHLPPFGNHHGDGWLTRNNGHLHVWDGSRWVDEGPFRGPQGVRGPEGQEGPPGIQGVRGPEGPEGVRGPQGIPGPEGPTGPPGVAGSGVCICGSVATSSELPGPASCIRPCSGYIAQDTGILWVWDGQEWVDCGQIRGPDGVPGPVGPEGPRGAQGMEGQRGPEGAEGPRGPQGELGPEGPRGPEGPMGAGIHLKGSVEDQDDLPAFGNDIGDAYFLEDTGHLWVWDGERWINAGHFRGPEGPRGPRGPEGPRGERGPEGPEGPQGVQGVEGPKGDRGDRGPQGPQGIRGATGPRGHTGPQGPRGPQGEVGPGVNIKGEVAEPEDLPRYGNQPGDAYIVTSSGHLWVWQGNGWVNAGHIVGPEGPPGIQGPPGEMSYLWTQNVDAGCHKIESLHRIDGCVGLLETSGELRLYTNHLHVSGPFLQMGYWAYWDENGYGYIAAIDPDANEMKRLRINGQQTEINCWAYSGNVFFLQERYDSSPCALPYPQEHAVGHVVIGAKSRIMLDLWSYVNGTGISFSDGYYRSGQDDQRMAEIDVWAQPDWGSLHFVTRGEDGMQGRMWIDANRVGMLTDVNIAGKIGVALGASTYAHQPRCTIDSGPTIAPLKISTYVNYDGAYGIGVAPGILTFIASNAFTNVQSLVPKMVLTETGRLGIGTQNPQAALDVNGQIQATGIRTTGSVGIGTQNPLAPLTVQGYYSDPITWQHKGIFKIQAQSFSNIEMGISNTAGEKAWIQAFATNQNSNVDIGLNPIGGRVGIGSMYPEAPLYISGQTGWGDTSRALVMISDREGGAGNPYLHFRTRVRYRGAGVLFYTGIENTDPREYRFDGGFQSDGYGTMFIKSEVGNVSLWCGPSAAAKVMCRADWPADTGGVGIHVSTPSYPLDVAGNARFRDYIFATRIGVGVVYANTPIDTGPELAPVKIATHTSSTLAYGIGVAASKLTFGASINPTTGTPQMVLTTAGRLGVGVQDPQYPVDIAGDVNISASSVYRVGGVPISGGGGGASQWTDIAGGIYYPGGKVLVGGTSQGGGTPGVDNGSNAVLQVTGNVGVHGYIQARHTAFSTTTPTGGGVMISSAGAAPGSANIVCRSSDGITLQPLTLSAASLLFNPGTSVNPGDVIFGDNYIGKVKIGLGATDASGSKLQVGGGISFGWLFSNNFQTTDPGAGSKRFWADPSDGYRVKYAP